MLHPNTPANGPLPPNIDTVCPGIPRQPQRSEKMETLTCEGVRNEAACTTCLGSGKVRRQYSIVYPLIRDVRTLGTAIDDRAV